MFYAKSTGGFYLEAIHGKNIPADAVEISDEEHAALLAGQSSGKTISADADGFPVLQDQPVASLADSIAALVKQIDADADVIYAAALGNRATEYAQAETEAQAFKDNCGAVPPYVQAWATATGKSASWAADNILATATAWLTAQTAIRTNRLALKESAKRAADVEALNAVRAQWSAFIAAIKAQLGLS